MMSLGDIKPLSLRKIESTIWRNLYLVAQCKLSAKEMVDHVLNSIVDPATLKSFGHDKTELCAFFKREFEPICDHMSFFFPGKVYSSFVVLIALNTLLQLRVP